MKESLDLLGRLSLSSIFEFVCCHLHVHAVLPVLLLLLLRVSAAVAQAHASTLHDACPSSWSDTVRV